MYLFFDASKENTLILNNSLEFFYIASIAMFTMTRDDQRKRV